MEIYQIYLTGSLLLLLLDGDSVPGGAAGPELPAREGRGAQGHQVGQHPPHHEGSRQDHRYCVIVRFLSRFINRSQMNVKLSPNSGKT